MEPPKYKVRVTVIGAYFTGKSTLIENFVTGVQPSKYVPTVETLWRKRFNLAGVEYSADIVDTSGDLKILNAFLDEYIAHSDAFLCVYSVTDVNSVTFLEEILPRLGVDRSQLGRTKEGTPVLIVGNKHDCVNEYGTSVVAQGKALAIDLMCPAATVSALATAEAERVFEKIILRGAKPIQPLTCSSSSISGYFAHFLSRKGHAKSAFYTEQGDVVRSYSEVRYLDRPVTTVCMDTEFTPVPRTRSESGNSTRWHEFKKRINAAFKA